ncbi:hypothetical protein [Nostoc sp.]|uniref:hypothetical protein n=1 Tax=Nostoc sp. TaxID=1180 RepID=UPI002FFD1498
MSAIEFSNAILITNSKYHPYTSNSGKKSPDWEEEQGAGETRGAGEEQELMIPNSCTDAINRVSTPNS